MNGLNKQLHDILVNYYEYTGKPFLLIKGITPEDGFNIFYLQSFKIQGVTVGRDYNEFIIKDLGEMLNPNMEKDKLSYLTMLDDLPTRTIRFKENPNIVWSILDFK